VSFCSREQLLEYVLQGTVSNTIKSFGFFHWTPINFKIRWPMARVCNEFILKVIILLASQQNLYLNHSNSSPIL
jgi:hypothetical protein